MSKLAWLRLALTDGLGPVLTARLIEAAGSVEAACEASLSLLKKVEGIGSKRAESIHQSLLAARDLAARELDQAEKSGVKIITRGDDEEYPSLLKTIPAPPMVLWIRGEFMERDLNSIAIVGSRNCSVYGREQSERFGSGLAGVGLTIVSGGARGVDTHAHRGAMVPVNGRTLAVLGCGVDIAYPPENADLLSRITSRGAVVSDFPLNTPPIAENFPRRNRLISGLSRGVLVIEADMKSGALITARYANNEHNRPVFALPGRVDNPLSAGPHRLIRDGATLVESMSDLLDNLGSIPIDDSQVYADHDAPDDLFPEDSLPVDSTLSDRQKIVLNAIEDESTIDEITDRSGLPVNIVMQELTMLSIRGSSMRISGQTYRKKSK